MLRVTRNRLIVCVLVVVTFIITPRGGLSAATVDPAKQIVIFVDGTPLVLQQLIVTSLGGQIIHVLSLINALAIRLPLGDRTTILQRLLSDPNVLGVFEDSIGVIALDTIAWLNPSSEENFGWGQDHIRIPAVYDHGDGPQGSGVTVAVLDTGIDLDHPDLRPNIVGGFNAISEGKSYDDNNGHGTHMAGIIAATANGQGIIGTASQAKLMAVKVLDETGSGYLSDCINGLQWVRNQDIRVLNMSLSFANDTVPLQRAIHRLYQAGAIMVAAAGNCGQAGGGVDEDGGADGGGTACNPSQPAQNAVLYPAAYPEVIAVVATDIYDHITDYSRSGPAVAVAAPGGAKASERILSTAPGGGYALGSGTSQAAAHTSGVVALALQGQWGLSFDRVVELLQLTARDLGYPPERQGAGLLNAPKMIQALQ